MSCGREAADIRQGYQGMGEGEVACMVPTHNDVEVAVQTLLHLPPYPRRIKCSTSGTLVWLASCLPDPDHLVYLQRGANRRSGRCGPEPLQLGLRIARHCPHELQAAQQLASWSHGHPAEVQQTKRCSPIKASDRGPTGFGADPSRYLASKKARHQ